MTNKKLLTISSLAGLIPLSLGVVLLGSVVSPIIVTPAFAENIIAQNAPTEKKRIVVLDFDFANTGDSGYWYAYRGGEGGGRAMSEILINKLINDGSYIVTPTSVLEGYMKKNNISGPIDEATAIEIGKSLGVDLVIVGTVTKFNVEQKSSGGSAFGIGARSSKTEANVQITARAIDTNAQSIVAAFDGVGEVSKGGGSGSFAGISASSSNTGYDEVLSEASEAAISDLVEKMKNSL